MRSIRKLFYSIITLIIVPTTALICLILWSYTTGNSIKLPAFAYSLNDTNFLLEAPVQTAPVYHAGTDRLAGIRAYIQISKDDLRTMSAAQYQEFYETTLRDSEYIWFSVVCPDGTGLYIPNCADGSACFCTLTDMGQQKEIYGYMIESGGSCTYTEAR